MNICLAGVRVGILISALRSLGPFLHRTRVHRDVDAGTEGCFPVCC